MKKRKLKGFVLPTLYLLITISIFTSVVLLGNNLSLKDNVESVIVEDEIASSNIVEPVDKDKATASIHFYSKDDTSDVQEQSLIYYENTYIPNTGTLYTSDEPFEVKSVFEGKVTDILDDEFFGKYIVVEHTKNLRTYYYGLEEIEVEVGDEITSGGVLGISKVNEIINNKKSFLLEVYHNNELINPETFIGTKITDYE